MSVILIFSFGAYGLLASQNLRVAFFVLVGLLPTYLIRFSLFGIPTTALETMFWILFVFWLLKREKRFVDIAGWKIIILLWLAVSTLAIFISPDIKSALGIWKAYFVEPLMFFIMANDFLHAKEDRRLALKVLAGTAIIIGLTTIFQKFTSIGVPPPFNHPEEFRATSFFGFPNAIGLFLAPLIPLFMGMLITSGKRSAREKYLWLTAIVLSLTAVVLAESEGAMVGIMAGLFLMGVMFARTRWYTIALTTVAVVVLLIIPITRPIVLEKVTLEDWSGRVRKEMWQETSTMLQDRPLFGAGLAGYPIVFAPYHKAGHIEIFQYPHNIILNLWSELGFAGVLIFLAIIIQFFRKTFRAGCNFRKEDPWFIALSASMIVLIVHGLVDVPYFKNDLSFLFWLIIALLASSTALKNKVKSDNLSGDGQK